MIQRLVPNARVGGHGQMDGKRGTDVGLHERRI
jgi:hypothetical protein